MTTLPRGLVSYRPDGSRTYIPLISVSAKVYIVDVSARVVLTQLYVSDRNSDKSSKAQYVFPVPASGAVCAFKMQASGGQVVTGVVKERSKAKEEYDIAISNDKWAGLLYETTPDVFVISIGAIPRGQDIEVTITYVVELSDGDLQDRVEFCLPTYIAERYGAAPSALVAPSSSSKGTAFNVTAQIQMTSSILSVTSPSHSIKVVAMSKKDPKTSMYTSTVKLAPEARSLRLDSDFILAIQASKLGEPRCVAEKRAAERTVALSLTLVPRFKLENLPAQEYIFLIDRSGSMAGSRINDAKDALLVFLQCLPKDGTSFNIFSFGSHCSALWPSSQPYTPSALDIAQRHVGEMSADMGGTEVGSGLENALRSQSRSIPTSLFLLTDGEVWQRDDVFSLVDREVIKAGNAASGTYLRIFTLGIGDTASTALCDGVARRGNGLCLMTSDSSNISPKVAKLFSASRVPPLGGTRDIEIDWGYAVKNPAPGKKAAHDKGKITHRVAVSPNPLGSANTQFHINLPDPPKVQQAPTRVPNLYPENRFTIFVILSDTTKVPKTVALRGTLLDGSQISLPPIPVHEAVSRDIPPLIHTLAAHRLVLELEDGDASSQGSFDTTDKNLHDAVIEAAVVRFSETYQLASQFASFIAVYEAQDGRSDSDSNSETESDDFQDGQHDMSDNGSGGHHDSDDDFQGGLTHKSDSGSVGQQRDNPPGHSDQEGDNPDNDISNTRRDGDGADPPSSGEGDDDFSSISSMSSHSSSWSARDDFSFGLFPNLKSNSRKARPPMRGEVDMPGGWLVPEPQAVTTQVGPKTKKKPITTTTWNARAPIVTAARLQQFDGSFNLDDKLCSFIGNKRSAIEVKAAMPPRIQGAHDAEKIWATVLAVAYMKVHLADDKEVWFGLWQKAADYIKLKLGDDISFTSLVDEAVKLL